MFKQHVFTVFIIIIIIILFIFLFIISIYCNFIDHQLPTDSSKFIFEDNFMFNVFINK